ncbi:9492_t:CDS:2 [Acaulospora morrowiae]|uniref:9492_t:CDS:1 n=1 Tax=Acaulospora morrowiae TaxID=94023 RepID=A0A9N8VW38_9GLOM|nr:9492_t:CDS:2 [Acaulospora morrowiae]
MSIKGCRNCSSLQSQIDQKDVIIEKFQRIARCQFELIQDLSQGENFNYPTTTSFFENEALLTARPASGKSVANRSYYRAYIGPLTDDIDKDALKTILETSFGTVEALDFIPGKSCAFANFSSPSAYHNAVSVGAVQVKGNMLSVEQAKKPLRSPRNNRKKFPIA